MDDLTISSIRFIDWVAGSTLLLNLTAAIIYCVCTRKVTQFVLVSFGVVLLGVAHQVIRFLLKKTFQFEEYLDVINLLWYTSFALTDLVFVSLVIYFSNIKRLLKDRVSNIVLLGYMVMAAIQLARYIERTYFNSDVLLSVYTGFIPIINVCITLIILGFVLKVLVYKVGSWALFLYLSVRGE
jgi:hypothetical protein